LAQVDFDINSWPLVLERRGRLVDVWLPREALD
jgi:hypothetical protein